MADLSIIGNHNAGWFAPVVPDSRYTLPLATRSAENTVPDGLERMGRVRQRGAHRSRVPPATHRGPGASARTAVS